MLAALVFALAFPAVAAEAPVSLTASDGSGLTLVGYDADTVMAGPLAFTELRLAFDNPQDRVIEGRFRLVLPDGAAVSRFAMKIGDSFQEGEVVEKQAARRAYEDALHRNQDPALLEQASPNEFSARVFPIPAKGRKEIIVSWSQELSSSTAPWRLNLVGLPEIGNFKARVRQGGKDILSEQKVKFVPAKDLVVPASSSGVLRSEDVVVARIKPLASAPAADLAGTLILMDTSASRGLGEGGDRKLVTDLVAALLKAQPSLSSQALHVLAFDQVTQSLYDGTFGAFAGRGLAARRALGASDVGFALDAAAVIARDKKPTRVILVGDGVLTAGVEGDALVSKVKALQQAGVRRLDAVAVGGLRDDAQLRRLVAGTLPEEGAVIGAGPGSTGGVDEIAKRLRLQAKSGLTVEVTGASWVWPRRLDGVQPGDEVLVIAELPSPQKNVEIKVAGRTVDVGSVDTSAPAPLLRRAWARAKIARLLDARERETEKTARGEINDQIVKVSVAWRVLSPLTALVVLETEADYARFGIPRDALADILTVDAAGLSLVKRKAIVVPEAPKPVAKKPEPRKDREKAKKSAAREGERESAGDKMVAAEGEDESDSDDAPAAEEAKEARSESAPPPPSAGAPAPRRALAPSAPSPSSAPAAASRPSRGQPITEVSRDDSDSRQAPADEPERPKVEAYTGPFAEVMALLEKGRVDDAVKKARGWREEQKGDLLALLALGEALEKKGDVTEAGRAYGSLVDLFSDRADIRRLAGARLDRLAGRTGDGVKDAARLAEDTWRRAADDRPDHPQGPRGQAWALVRLGRHAEAMDVVEAAIKRGNPSGRFSGVDQILLDDAALVGAAWAKAEPAKKGAIQARVKAVGGVWADKPSLRFVLWWETDANDVDFHIHDGKKAHAYYSQRDLPSGGRLYADVTTGFGPECFTIEGPPKAFPYRLEAHYYSRGPMGFGMGAMRVVQHDGRGGILVEDRPFVIMVDGAYVDLGVVKGPLQ